MSKFSYILELDHVNVITSLYQTDLLLGSVHSEYFSILIPHSYHRSLCTDLTLVLRRETNLQSLKEVYVQGKHSSGFDQMGQWLVFQDSSGSDFVRYEDIVEDIVKGSEGQRIKEK